MQWLPIVHVMVTGVLGTNDLHTRHMTSLLTMWWQWLCLVMVLVHCVCSVDLAIHVRMIMK